MPETFAQYLEKWLKQSTAQGLTNPLVKMPVKRFRQLQPADFDSIANGGNFIIGTTSDPIARNLLKNFQTNIRERGEHCAFICFGSVEMTIAGGLGQQHRTALFPVALKRATLQLAGANIKVSVQEEETWRFNPVLEANLRQLGIPSISETLAQSPARATSWLSGQLGNRASQVKSDSYVGLFSSQQMVVQERLKEPLFRQALAQNPVIKAKIAGETVEAVELGENSDDGLEELGLVLPCDDSQLRVIQLTNHGCSLQVEGPPGTGKSQTIANIVSNALYQGRNVLLVCDKRAAIVQVEERLAKSGLQPALLNLHDEELDKREFLRQASARFPSDLFAAGRTLPAHYPFDQLKQLREALNGRVKKGRQPLHPSLPVSRHQAVGGLIQLRKVLKDVPKLDIPNWQTLSKDRLSKILNSIAEWPGLAQVISDSLNIWNRVCVETFEEDANAANLLRSLCEKIATQILSLEDVKEWTATVGIKPAPASDSEVAEILALVEIVIARPDCHPKLVGNRELTIKELHRLKEEWDQLQGLIAARHPVPLGEIYPPEAEREARDLLNAEVVASWQQLTSREVYNADRHTEIATTQKAYQRLCDQIGLIYSPHVKVRRAQMQAVLSLGAFGGLIPRRWWDSSVKPVLEINGWHGKLRACATHAKSAPLPLNFVALERVAPAHWSHVEAMAEHGFNLVSYCFKFINDRRCKFALRQVYPEIPVRGFKKWREVTLHAVTAYQSMQTVRAAADGHVIIRQLTENFFSSSHEDRDAASRMLDHEDVGRLQNAAAVVEQLRDRNDLFEINSVHWQTFWESSNPHLLKSVQSALEDLETLPLPRSDSDDLEAALKFYADTRQRIENFLQKYERLEGDRTRPVLKSFAAQKDFARCNELLIPLAKYLSLEAQSSASPDWARLETLLQWRDLFERLCGSQTLDVDSKLWPKLQARLSAHHDFMPAALSELDTFIERCTENVSGYAALLERLAAVLADLPRHPLWLEKRRWSDKISAYPELHDLWQKAVAGGVVPEHASRLFCFNLIRLCNPIATPNGPELGQTVKSFVEHDENLTTWVLEHLISRLRKTIQEASRIAPQSEAELRRLAGLQRVRGTVRELVNAHRDYLLEAKPCWMMSPTSLANLIDTSIFSEHGIPFDLVIFDEASQIRVFDGLLSMTFGKQVIIVGDNNQLPPTNFFASFANAETEADSQDFGVSESLLQEFSGVFAEDKTHVMLMSHYRSETPDLIRFSNDWFYSSKLEIYPPAHVTGIGRRLHYVADGVYSETSGARNNPAEARAVVKLIETHVRECPDKSLGVVTMNISQMELIEEQLWLAPIAVQNFIADDAKFFLRNLETVQGDEMDRIILSLTYGKNPAGQFSAAVLGPVIKSGGDRRLNVAITRSRSGMTVVTSLRAVDLETSNAQSRGFLCLKSLLLDLENAEQTCSFGLTSKRFERHKDGISNVVFCESPFEEQVVEFLENLGHEIECQYGSGKFRLDIVVKEGGKNLLAIECDGAAYHSSLVARTRDRARQRLLEKLGWRFHRVWSTNWWFFEEQEKQAIISAINSARNAPRR
jgi:very-short-patch-repair endonuclease